MFGSKTAGHLRLTCSADRVIIAFGVAMWWWKFTERWNRFLCVQWYLGTTRTQQRWLFDGVGLRLWCWVCGSYWGGGVLRRIDFRLTLRLDPIWSDTNSWVAVFHLTARLIRMRENLCTNSDTADKPSANARRHSWSPANVRTRVSVLEMRLAGVRRSADAIRGGRHPSRYLCLNYYIHPRYAHRCWRDIMSFGVWCASSRRRIASARRKDASAVKE